MIYQNGKNPITEVIIHCAATRPNWMKDNTPQEQWEEIRHWHEDDRGWDDIGYHRGIARDGTILIGRKLTTQGAHVGGHNRGTLGICILGGHGSNEKDQFEDHYTEAQEDALLALLKEIREEVGADLLISGHNEYAAKACPGFDAKEWWHGVIGVKDDYLRLEYFDDKSSNAPPRPKMTPQPARPTFGLKWIHDLISLLASFGGGKK